MLEIADRVSERAAPDAWIVDFTNPVGIVTRALLDHGHRACGLCNVAIGFQRWIAAALRRARARRRRPGRAQPPDVDPLGRGGRRGHPRPAAGRLAGRHRRRDRPAARLIADLGVIPSYYLKYFYCHDQVVARAADGPPRAAGGAGDRGGLLEMYRDPTLVTKPALLEQRGGAFYSEAATQLVSSLAHRRRLRAGGRRAQRRRAARAGRRRRRRAAGAHRRRRPVPLPQAPLRPTCSASSSTSPPTSGWRRRGHRRTPGRAPPGAARASADRPGRDGVRAAPRTLVPRRDRARA